MMKQNEQKIVDNFIQLQLKEVQNIFHKMNPNQALIVQPTADNLAVEYLIYDREKAARIYENFGVSIIADVLRNEKKVPFVHIVCFNVLNVHKAFLVVETKSKTIGQA